MWKRLMAAAAAAAVLGGPGAASAAGDGVAADVAYHGRLTLSGGRLGVWLVPENHGPAALPNVTVRLTLSVDLADAQELDAGCARTAQRVIVCETGALPVRGSGRHIALVLPLKVPTTEVVVRIDTLWNGGATDGNPADNQHAVLALDTGDAYAF
ncbi:hypothetical protein ACWCQL_36845 [Streptomyces sp. NPDC002073]|uniref:hypothetical protein n=1 Tax=Streptomyces sp. NBC_00239 TaxID=2903640 RepID=UPI002E29D9B5|nr:hypothetical protein [Streptomyces sp. NBC_00239]